MSRSAIWRGQSNADNRKTCAQLTMEAAIEEGKMTNRKGEIKIVGNAKTFNLNSMLAQNIISSNYFQKICGNTKNHKELVDEIYNKVRLILLYLFTLVLFIY